MNGIEPPTPMSTGATPVPGLLERRPRGVVGRTGRVDLGGLAGVHHGVGGASTQGTLASQCLRRHSTAFAVVSPGAMRRVSLARATGTRVLLAPVDLRRVDPGDRQGRPGPEPLDDRAVADPLDRPVGAGLGTQPLLGVLDVGGRPLEEPRDGDVAGVVVEARDHPAQRHDRVGHQAARMPEWTPRPGVAHLDVGPHQPPQRRVVSAGSPMSQLPESAITITSARSLS